LYDLGLRIGVEDQVDVQRTFLELNSIGLLNMAPVEGRVLQAHLAHKAAYIVLKGGHHIFDRLQGILLLITVLKQSHGQG